MTPAPAGTAVISACEQYRYVLRRDITCALRWVRPLLFICLNPSTATATEDDPSIRRMIGFATLWQCTRLSVVNLFALRATDPRELALHADPVGVQNNEYIRREVAAHSRIGNVVAAWGAHPMARRRAEELGDTLKGAWCLSMNKDGSPGHPLYLKANSPRIPWTGYASAA